MAADPRKLKDEVAKHWGKQKFSKAAEVLEELIKAEPKIVEHAVKLGDAHRKDGDKAKAIVAYEKAADLYLKGSLLIKAIACCKMILDLDATHTGTQEKLAELNAQRSGKPVPKKVERQSGAQAVEAALMEARIKKRAAPTPAEEPMELDAPAPAPKKGAPIELDESDDGMLDLDVVETPAAKKGDDGPIELDDSAGEPMELEDADDDSLDIDIDAGEPAPAAAAKPSAPAKSAKPAAKAPPPKAPEPDQGLDLGLDMGDDALAAAMAEASDSVQKPGKGAKAAKAAKVEEPDEPEGDDLSLDEPMSLPPPPPASAPAPAAAATVAPEDLFGSFSEDDDTTGAGIAFDDTEDDGDEIEFAIGAGATTAEPAAESDGPPPEPPAPPDFEPEPWGFGADPHGAGEPEPPSAEPEASFLASPEDGQRAAAVQEMPEIPLFSDLPRDAFVELTTRMGFRRVDAGEVIIQIGDPGDRFFIISTGKVKVYKPGADGSEVTLATLEEGAFFGEMALLSGNPRSASVAAETDCDLLEIPATLLAEMAQQYPVVAGALRKFYKQRLLSNVMALSPLFQPFSRVERRQLVEKFKMREVGPGEVVLKEGVIADGLYVLLAGEVEVEKDGSKLGPIGEGEIFGEVSLLNRRPATANVIASRKSWLLRLPKPAFDEVIITHPQILELVATLNDQQQKSVGMAI